MRVRFVIGIAAFGAPDRSCSASSHGVLSYEFFLGCFAQVRG